MTEQQYLDTTASQIALAELIRLLIANAAFHPDETQFRSTISQLESFAVDCLNSRTLFPTAPAETEQYMKDAASGWISNICASIVHPQR